MRIEVGNQTIEIEDGASDDAIQRAIATYRSSPEFDAVVDKKSGAPARVRMLVGSASGRDKLKALTRLYEGSPYR